jgi:nicotinamidase-related amidase
MCDAMTECTDFLWQGGFKTLLFTGINTDVCVAATLQDANLKGFDTVPLKDGCGTTNGEKAKKVIERNCKGVENMVK